MCYAIRSRVLFYLSYNKTKLLLYNVKTYKTKVVNKLSIIIYLFGLITYKRGGEERGESL